MANINNRVKLWRGTRDNYNAVVTAGTVDYWTEYNVKEGDGTWRKYFGTREVTGDVGELRPVERILTTEQFSSLTNDEKEQGARYLVGSGESYYIVEFGPTPSIESTKIEPLGSYSVRVKSDNLRAYQMINHVLDSYDHSLLHDCGEY